MGKIDVYKVVITLTYETQADSTQDATDKADTYLAAHADEADHQVTQREVWIGEEE